VRGAACAGLLYEHTACLARAFALALGQTAAALWLSMAADASVAEGRACSLGALLACSACAACLARNAPALRLTHQRLQRACYCRAWHLLVSCLSPEKPPEGHGGNTCSARSMRLPSFLF